jgi:hypothetical protein
MALAGPADPACADALEVLDLAALDLSAALKLDGMTARFRLRPETPSLTVEGGLMHECAGAGDLSRTVVLPEGTDEAPDELEVEARLLVLFHRPRDEFRGFIEIRLVDVQVVEP